jgi:RNA polymerase sigma-70 factor, ECF subfamily
MEAEAAQGGGALPYFGQGNKSDLRPFSGRQVRSNRPARRDRGAMSPSFTDQLIAVLPRLRRFARGLAKSAFAADDLVQAACERALTREHQFQEGTRFDSWMFRIVQTIWIDQIRARDVRKEESEDEGHQIGSDESVRRAEARMGLNEVRAVLRELPPDQRAALMLVTVEGLSYREAAEIADVPVGTIMSRLARARVALHAKLEAGGAFRRSVDDVEAER